MKVHSLDHSWIIIHWLANPNQSRHPYDSEKQLGINIDDVYIPFGTSSSMVYFDTYVPNNEELETLPHVVLTDGDSEWDPRVWK